MTASAERLAAALSDRYRIERELGSGGMAIVYLSHDVKHDRKVALKVLRSDLAAVIGAERFLAEIRTTANLQHPHILPLFDSGQAGAQDGGPAPFLFYVMPLVEGESLRERLQREKQLPVNEAVRIARDVADALDYAHRHDVVHRDIKPENIMLHDGRAVVADFGIALAVNEASGTRITETGMSLGTPHYMSPEQAMGERNLDGRTDIYALGAVLYEMLTGEPPFTGPTTQSIVAKVITSAPEPVTTYRKTVSPQVEHALQTALAKLPADRFSLASEFAKALGDPGLPFTISETKGRSAQHVGARSLLLTTSAVAVVAVAVALWTLLRTPPPRPVLRFSMALPDGQRIVDPYIRSAIALSADGSTLAYTGNYDGDTWQLWVRRRDELRATAVRGTVHAVEPTLSPDGRAVAFTTGSPGPLVVAQVAGGVSRTVADSAAWGSLEWGDDGILYYLDVRGGISRVSSEGGAPEHVIDQPSSGALRRINVLPGGRSAIVTFVPFGSLALGDQRIHVVRFDTGESTELVAGTTARYVPPGYLVWATGAGDLLAAPFDVDDLALTGAPVVVAQGVHLGRYGNADFAVSDSGTLLYRTGEIGTTLEPVWVSRDGTTRAITEGWEVLATPQGSRGISISPDGSRVALAHFDNGMVDIWVRELLDGTFRRLTFHGLAARPSWTPEGHTVVYAATPSIGLPRILLGKAVDGGSNAEVLVEESRAIDQGLVSHDGAWIVYRLGQGSHRDMYAIRIGIDSIGRPLLTGDHDEKAPALAPNDRWLAYVSNESGQEEVYVRPFPDVHRTRWQISNDGGTEPVWGRSGNELFYRNVAGDLVSVGVSIEPTFSIARRRVLFSSSAFLADPSHALYDVAPDGRFAMLRYVQYEPGELIWVENWTSVLQNANGGS